MMMKNLLLQYDNPMIAMHSPSEVGYLVNALIDRLLVLTNLDIGNNHVEKRLGWAEWRNNRATYQKPRSGDI